MIVVFSCCRRWRNNKMSLSIPFPFGWLLNKKAARIEVNISLAFLHWVGIALHPWPFVSDIAIFVLKGDAKLQLTNSLRIERHKCQLKRALKTWGKPLVVQVSAADSTCSLQCSQYPDPAWAGVPPSAFAAPLSIHFLIFCSLLLFPFFLFSFTLPILLYCPSDPFLTESSRSVFRREVVGGDWTWV